MNIVKKKINQSMKKLFGTGVPIIVLHLESPHIQHTFNLHTQLCEVVVYC